MHKRYLTMLFMYYYSSLGRTYSKISMLSAKSLGRGDILLILIPFTQLPFFNVLAGFQTAVGQCFPEQLLALPGQTGVGAIRT